MCRTWNITICNKATTCTTVVSCMNSAIVGSSTREGSCYSLRSKDAKDATMRMIVVIRPTATARACLVLVSRSTPCHAIPMPATMARMTRKVALPSANQASPPTTPPVVCQPCQQDVPTLELLDARQDASPSSPRHQGAGESGVSSTPLRLGTSWGRCQD
jgi:hypothetical protein